MTMPGSGIDVDLCTAADDVDRSLEDYLLLVLSDSNLPTGGFVASSGLESWLQHGYASTVADSAAGATATPDPTAPSSAKAALNKDGPVNAFISQSLDSYARLNAPLLRRAHAAAAEVRSRRQTSLAAAGTTADGDNGASEAALSSLLATDALCETMTLNHVARRASVAQGVALLTLYERAFSPTPGSLEASRDAAVVALVAQYRLAIKLAREGANGHMSVAFGVLTAAIGISVGKLLLRGSLPTTDAGALPVRCTKMLISKLVRRFCPPPFPLPARPLALVFRRPDELDRTVPRASRPRQRHAVHDRIGSGASRRRACRRNRRRFDCTPGV